MDFILFFVLLLRLGVFVLNEYERKDSAGATID